MSIQVQMADYRDPDQAAAIASLLDRYARDPMGGGRPLDPEKLERLAGELARRPHAFTVLAYVHGRPVGLANCFELFSTFACRPLVNIHDIVVDREHRGRGIGRALLTKVEAVARSRGCCKLTLEVLEGNAPARRAYQSFGFAPYQLREELGQAMFWEKPLGE